MNRVITSVCNYFDNEHKLLSVDQSDHSVDWHRIIPFLFLHLACLGVFLVGWSPVAVAIAVASYLIRMFAITAFFHRYFSHKSFSTSRPVQFVFAFLGTAATQRGPLWWAAHHRAHHRAADTENDVHSPLKGFWYSHCGWFLSGAHFATRQELIKDFASFPELRWLDRFDMAVAAIFGTSLWLLGEALAWLAPELGTNGWQLLVWAYFISTVVLIHATLSINSLAHWWGRRRYDTRDDSRNNFLLALITLGEGWHNNHHHYAGSARQGFFWWELDISYLILKMLSWTGLVWNLKPVPDRKKFAHQPVRGAQQR